MQTLPKIAGESQRGSRPTGVKRACCRNAAIAAVSTMSALHPLEKETAPSAGTALDGSVLMAQQLQQYCASETVIGKLLATAPDAITWLDQDDTNSPAETPTAPKAGDVLVNRCTGKTLGTATGHVADRPDGVSFDQATFRRKSPITIAQGRRDRAKAIDPPVDDRRGCDRGDLWRGGRLRGRLGSDRTAKIDEVVGDDPEADPAPHSIIAAISAPLETVSALAHTDAPLTPRAPSLPVAEPSLLLLLLARGALAAAIGDADPFDAFGFRRRLVLGGIEPGISGDEARVIPALLRAPRSPASADPNHSAAEHTLRRRR